MMVGGSEVRVKEKKDEEMTAKETVTISRNVLTQLIEAYVRTKTSDHGIILTDQNVSFQSDAKHQITGADITWRKTYK